MGTLEYQQNGVLRKDSQSKTGFEKAASPLFITGYTDCNTIGNGEPEKVDALL